ncbi:hypothetical protein [Nocardia cyriacigeorgica]|uniref:hypothetical protein n=1 Tax=Nocardia cyriacigeorgica TaxID=135487 RepID=UPI002456E4FE|nr:hypothetical protein [Nocardia cyriacigeorgica]
MPRDHLIVRSGDDECRNRDPGQVSGDIDPGQQLELGIGTRWVGAAEYPPRGLGEFRAGQAIEPGRATPDRDEVGSRRASIACSGERAPGIDEQQEPGAGQARRTR